MLSPHLASRVGRRLFALFLVAALLPLGGLAIFAYVRVGEMLVDIHDRQLRQDSKALGMSFVQELNWRARLFQRELARDSEHPHLPEGFLGMTRLAVAPQVTPGQAHHLAQGKVLLRLSPTEEAGMLLGSATEGGFWFARLDLASLWRNDAVPEYYCVFDTGRWPLYCSPGMRPPPEEFLTPDASGTAPASFGWRLDGEPFLGSLWQARLMAGYAHPGLMVVVAEPESILHAGLRPFRLIFAAISLLAFSLALLLASNQIRRTLRPLDRLLDGTRALSSGNFSARVEVSGGDEFAMLAHSFNRMSDALRGRFHTLQMLTDLDRVILGTSDMDDVIDSVMRHIHRALPCDGAGILRIHGEGGGRLHVPGTDGRSSARAYDCPDVPGFLPADDTPTWHVVHEGDQAMQDCLAHMAPEAGEKLRRVCVFPVRGGARLEALLVLAWKSPPAEADEIVKTGLVLADRLAVAAANIAWSEKLYHQGHFDALTDLPNRVLLRERAELALARARKEGRAVGLLIVDLDGFKQVNDSLGHSAGDVLLRECARRLGAIAHPGATVARAGGDEFILLLPDLCRDEAIHGLDEQARAIHRALGEPMMLLEHRIVSLASVGIALAPDDAADFEALFKAADAALHESKQGKPGSHGFYSRRLNEQIQERFEMMQALRAAIENDEFLLHYQPKVQARTGRIVGAEALIRWNSPARGLVPPGRFLSLLAEMGRESWLAEWVMTRACAQMEEWDRQKLQAIPVSINLSPANFAEPGLVARAVRLLERHRLAPGRLEFEILEATVANESPAIRATLLDVREAGIGIALDDFGTGYSSLVYLTQLPANVLKLDRAFILDLATDPRQQSIVGGIIDLAHGLGFKIVAEGVEEEIQRELLVRMGCEMIQGYLFGRPVPAAEFAARLGADARDDTSV